MKRFWFVAFVVVALAACPAPTNSGLTRTAIVKNSNWDTVQTASVVSAKAVDAESLESEVAAYNATHTDDQLVVYYDEAPEATEAPEADVFITHPYTTEIQRSYLGVPREEVKEKREAWAYEAYFIARDELGLLDEFGEVVPCVAYVDNIPPAPGVPAPVDPYERFALYQVRDLDGLIVAEAHPAAEDYRALWAAYSVGVELNNRDNPADTWTFIYGRLYTEPVPPPPEE